MLIGLIGGTFTSIARQRYNDSVRDFAEFMRRMYSEAISPQSLSNSGTVGSDTNRAILGKIIEFNSDGKIYTATIVGNADAHKSDNLDFITEFTEQNSVPGSKATNASIYCGDAVNPSSVQEYTPLWEAELVPANNMSNTMKDPSTERLIGTMIIGRTPTSATIHTIFAPGRVYGINENCSAANANFQLDLDNQHRYPDNPAYQVFGIEDTVGICIKSDNSAVRREIRIAADGRNSSAIWIRNTDVNEVGDEDQCN